MTGDCEALYQRFFPAAGDAPRHATGDHVMPAEELADSSVSRSAPSGALIRRLYLWAVMVSGTAVLCWSLYDVSVRPPGALWLVLAVLTVVSSAAAIRMPGFPVSFSLSDTFIIIAALLFGPAAGSLLVAVDALIVSWRFKVSRLTLERVAFNVTSVPLAMFLAAHLFFALTALRPIASDAGRVGPLLLPLGAFASAYFLLNTGLVAGAIAIGRRTSFVGVWREHFLPLWVTHFGGTAIAGLFLVMMSAGFAHLMTLVLGVPLALVLFVAVLQGIERMRRRSAQFAELRLFAAALHSTADGVVVTDVDDRITFMNPVAERLTGWPMAEARERPVRDVLRMARVPETDPDRTPAENASEGPGLREYTLLRHDGTTCPIEQTFAHVRDEDEDVTGVIRTFRDITQRRAIEKERRDLLRQQEEARAAADEANRSKDEFLATLSHELRTPMASILGWVELLRSGKIDAERTEQALASLERGARAQATVVNDLLDISRIMRGSLRLDIRRTHLPSVLRDAAETVEAAVQAKRLRLDLHVAPDVSTIDADPDRLRQVFWNLLANAVKFTPSGGSIEVVAQRHADMVHVDVIDNGCGIDAAFLPFVFDRFRQQDGSPGRDHGGLGLGLAIVRELVELHGGTVEARSDGDHRGSRFVVRLPAVLRRREHDRPAASATPR